VRVKSNANTDSEGNAGLPFIALLIGFVFSVPASLLCGKPYIKAIREHGKAPPELRLISGMISAVLVRLASENRLYSLVLTMISSPLVYSGWGGQPIRQYHGQHRLLLAVFLALPKSV
jgi:hypothetical protein